MVYFFQAWLGYSAPGTPLRRYILQKVVCIGFIVRVLSKFVAEEVKMVGLVVDWIGSRWRLVYARLLTRLSIDHTR